MDIALQAYSALFQAGLINDYLLPVNQVTDGNERYATVEKRPNVVEISNQIDVLRTMAELWKENADIHESIITVWFEGTVRTQVMIILPRTLHDIPSFEIFWDDATTLNVSITPNHQVKSKLSMTVTRRSTSILLGSVYSSRMKDNADFTALFVPFGVEDLGAWLDSNSGMFEAHSMSHADTQSVGLVRDLRQNKTYVFHDVKYASREDVCFEGAMEVDQSPQLHENLDDIDGDGYTILEVKRLSKRADFLHRIPVKNQVSAAKSGLKALLADNCAFDKLPFNYAQFALLVPSILHKIQVR